ncbi:IS3 family transposase [Kitasatospora sp. NPDC087315]|uniref:IS3 family transposase n=1 Tax=Kitasatospora sp. NPDC087315 TaxID=3364069 RepID=UPI0038004475
MGDKEVEPEAKHRTNCCDNAAAESFFGLLKAEIGTTVWESREAARADVFRFIEVEYNRARLTNRSPRVREERCPTRPDMGLVTAGWQARPRS